jgi:molybdenum-dependent DNA-binding transcriptional regulator ModE
MASATSENRISRRLRFRDLQVFFAVVQCGSMAKAASELGVTQPAVSEVVAGLEQAFGVRLFDRSPRGVEPTIYGRALLKRGIAAFDELKQCISDIEFLADPTKGEVRLGRRLVLHSVSLMVNCGPRGAIVMCPPLPHNQTLQRTFLIDGFCATCGQTRPAATSTSGALRPRSFPFWRAGRPSDESSSDPADQT